MDVPDPALTPEQIIERKLIDCGLPAAGFSVRFEDYLQSIEIVIPSATKIEAAQFECIRVAAGTEIVTIEDAGVADDYRKYEFEKMRPELLTMATDRVRKARILGNFPRRSAYPSLTDYAEALERHVGIASGDGLKVQGETLIVQPLGLGDRKSERLSAAVLYASLIEDTVNFGYVGNAAIFDAKEDK